MIDPFNGDWQIVVRGMTGAQIDEALESGDPVRIEGVIEVAEIRHSIRQRLAWYYSDLKSGLLSWLEEFARRHQDRGGE